MTDYCNSRMYLVTAGNNQNRISSTSNTPSPLDEVMDISGAAPGYYISRSLQLAGANFAVQAPYYANSGYMVHYGDATSAILPYSGSSSSDEQPFMANNDVLTASSSPTSIVSTQSVHSYHSGNAPDATFESSYFDLTAPITQLHIDTLEGYRSGASDERYDQHSNAYSYMPGATTSEYNQADRISGSLATQSSNKSSCGGSTQNNHNTEMPSIKLEEAPVKRTTYKKKHSHQKKKKRCYNCQSTNAPSWRRSISERSKGNLLCNACGLYEKTQKTNRKLVTGPDGLTKVVRKRDSPNYRCADCGTQGATKWYKSNEALRCLSCVRSQRKASL